MPVRFLGMPPDNAPTAAEIRNRLDRQPGWYHTFEVAPGLTTPGRFDFRPALAHIPWPNVRRKRCLEVGTRDGFLAFELERQGAAEVVAIDGDDDHLGGACFQLAAELLGSRVDRRPMSVYDLDPAEVGRFDVVVCAGLLRCLHDPVRALEAIRSVTGAAFLSVEQIELWLSVLGRGRPLLQLGAAAGQGEWFRANGAGHKGLLAATGFEIERLSRPFAVPFNRGPRPPRTLSNRVSDLATRLVTGGSAPGVLHRALLAR
ncbi:MAG: class I SAM-dependent methyltransferase [Acidimicrobiales bacterium]